MVLSHGFGATSSLCVDTENSVLCSTVLSTVDCTGCPYVQFWVRIPGHECQLSLTSSPELKTSQFPLCQVWSYGHIHLPPSISDGPTIAQSPQPQNRAVHDLVQVHGKSCATWLLCPTAASPPPVSPSRRLIVQLHRQPNTERLTRPPIKAQYLCSFYACSVPPSTHQGSVPVEYEWLPNSVSWRAGPHLRSQPGHRLPSGDPSASLQRLTPPRLYDTDMTIPLARVPMEGRQL
jgi:hypothetical protein